MSQFITNKPCDMCGKIEVSLTEMTVGKTKHHLCYKCITIFAFDIVEYAAHNLRTEFEQQGYTFEFDNNGGYIIKRKKSI